MIIIKLNFKPHPHREALKNLATLPVLGDNPLYVADAIERSSGGQ